MRKYNLMKIAAFIAVLFFCDTTQAQIYVTIRPPRPEVVIAPPPMPAPGYVWIEEEWVPQGRTYVYKGGYWIKPPRPHARWIPGHWKHTRRGYIWIKGHWRYKRR